MKLLLVISIIKILLTKGFGVFVNQEELTVALDIMKKLEIHEGMFFSDERLINTSEVRQIAPFVKILSSHNIITAFWDEPRFWSFINYHNHYHYHKAAFIMKNFARVNRFRGSEYVWLAFHANPKYSYKHFPIPYDCEFTDIRKSNPMTYKLTEIYTFKNKIFKNDFGKWDLNSGLITENLSIYWNRLNLNQTVINSLAFAKQHPDLCLEFHENKELMYNCQIYELTEEYSKMMNFRLNRTLITRFNHLTKYGEDLVEAPMVLMSYKEMTRNVLGPINSMLFYWFIKKRNRSFRTDYYLQPFEWHIWIFSIIILIIGTVLVLLENRIKRKKFEIGKILLLLEILCNQGNEDVESISLRTVVFTFNVIGLVLVNFFGAVITSFLSVDIPESPFHNLETFIKNGQYKILLNPEDVVKGYLEASNHHLEKLLFQNYTLSEDFDDYRKICYVKNLAVILSDDSYYNCELLKISKPFWKMWVTITLERFSPLKDNFHINWLRFREYGIPNTIKYKMKGIELRNLQDSLQPVEIDQMVQVLTIPIIGAALSLIIIVCELVCKWKYARSLT